MSKDIRHWWIQKTKVHNCPPRIDAVVFEEFCPSIGLLGHEWVKVISQDDLQLKIGNGLTHYVSKCEELATIKQQLKIAEEALDFYANRENWYQINYWDNSSNIKKDDVDSLCGIHSDIDNKGGKTARQAKAEIEKLRSGE